MASRDHSLDDGIIPWMTGSFRLPIRSFLLTVFRKPLCTRSPKKPASPREQSTQDTRIKTRCLSVCFRIFFEKTKVLFTPIAEERIYFQLLTGHYDDCTLFFCHSDGSSIETMLHELMDRKAEQTVEFFSHIYGKAPNADAIRLLIGSQFWYFRQLLDQHMEEGRMLTCLQAVLDFTNAGWRQLCDTFR